MSRYPKDHKARSRQALVDAAAKLFRERGYRGAGIDELCAAAGLTRGAFYAHFSSKRALFEAVLDGAHDFVKRLRARPRRNLPSGAAQVAGDYLLPGHRQAVLGGCSLASLAMDAIRGSDGDRTAYAQAVQQVAAEFRRENPELSADDAHAAVALCVGGLLVSGACGSDPTADRVARGSRRRVMALLDPARRKS